MKATYFILWLIITMILAVSVVGWVLLFPHQNNNFSYKPLSELRSTWMTIGYNLCNSLIKDK